MLEVITRPLKRLRKLADYAADLLEKIRKINALDLHFENQNAILFGTTEIVRRLAEFEKLRLELQKSNQLMNVTAAELAAFNDTSEKLRQRIGDLEGSLEAARGEIRELRVGISNGNSAGEA